MIVVIIISIIVVVIGSLIILLLIIISFMTHTISTTIVQVAFDYPWTQSLVVLISFNFYLLVTVHHEMSRNVPDGHFHVFFFFLKVNYMLFTTVKTIFKSEDLWPSYMFLNMVVRHSALLGKLALNVEDFYVKTIAWGLKKKSRF